MATIEELGGVKTSGDLILSSDWMAVVEEVVRLGAEVDRLQAEKADLSLVEAIQAEVGQLRTEVDALNVRVDAIDTSVTGIRAILGDYFQLRLSTTRATYAVGSQAELFVKLHDLEGDPIAFSAADARPWIDFVTTYGRFASAAGFVSRGGGQRAMSVQVNRDGEARVLLRAESAPGVTVLDEERMFTTMQAQVADGSGTLEQIILGSRTPVEAGARGAWRLINQEYDASPGSGVRRFLDNQYTWGRAQPVDFERQNWGQSFRDQDATVLAFLKPDQDPLTPDQSRAISSIQVTWREWFWPWIDVGYVAVDTDIFIDIRDDLLELIQEPPVIDLLGPRVQDVFSNYLDDRGLIERERNTRILIDVLDDANVPGGRRNAELVFQRGREALELQLSLDRGGTLAGTGSVGGGHVAAMIGTAGRTEAGLAAAEGLIAEQRGNVTDVTEQLAGLETQMRFFGGQVTEALAEGGRLTLAMDGIEGLRTTVDGLRETLSGPTDARVRDLQNNVQVALERIGRLGG